MFLTALLLQTATLAPIDVSAVCSRFSHYDQDGDGQVEIAALSDIGPARAAEPGPKYGRAGRVLIMVEGRILEPLDAPQGKEAASLEGRVQRLTADLSEEGYEAHLLRIDFAHSDSHQDGRYVLALREVLRAFHGDGKLQGVLLIGHFPDAYLVRTCNWRRKGNITLRKGQENEAKHQGVHYLRRIPEHVSQRADIVLADLDGRWEDVYVQAKTSVESTVAVFDGAIPGSGGPCIDLERRHLEFEDYFHISDGKLELRGAVGPDGAAAGHALFLDDRSADHECSATDRGRPNAIARPDIRVSRIDAWGSAQSPRAEVVGAGGERLLDGDGKPQTVTFESKEDVPHWRNDLWAHDPLLERRLIAEHLDLNHAYRTGASTPPWRPSSIACDLGSGYRRMARAATDWEEDKSELRDLKGKPTLEQFVQWMGHGAVLRTIRAHSNADCSVFAKGDVAALDEISGGSPWSWTKRGNRLVPSLAAACGSGRMNWFLLRTLWENGALAAEPSIYLHTGCEGVSPPGSRRRGYMNQAYGVRQGAEALLLMGRGVALMGRAKVFYDEPTGFAETLGAGGTVGDAWRAYFEAESKAHEWGHVGGDIGRKRSYFWSVLGDWSIRLATAAPDPKPLDTKWERVDLEQSQLLIPSTAELAASNDVPLSIHFQGGVSAAKRNFAAMNADGVLIASTLSGLSGAFSKPYQDPAAFAALLASAERELSERAGHPVRCAPITITFFSAGYGAVRELLQHPAHFDRIERLISADSIYASVVSESARAPEAAQMVDFMRFAQAAARGEKTFVLVHGMYATPYASTSECADLILASVGARREPSDWVNARGFRVATEAHAGQFHLYTFDVAEPHIHVECMAMIPELARKHP